MIQTKKFKKKDKEFLKLLELNGDLQTLGNDLVASIENAEWKNIKRFKKYTPHMWEAIFNWKENLKKNYTEIK